MTPTGARTPPPSRFGEISALETVTFNFDVAADALGLDDDIGAVLTTAYREITVQIPVRLSDGHVHVFSGFRIQHDNARGP